jgi:8-oxo-dGTP pyrophosphatase MutT (NUDIX family)
MTIAPAIPSASVILMREGERSPEILLVQRNAKIVFHGGSWVFPGGKVDEADAKALEKGDDLAIARRAGVREVDEEAGLQIDGDTLVPFSHWTTPENQPKRFAAWFFIGIVGADHDVTVDGSEIVDHRWVTVDEALNQRFSNEIALAPPAFVSLLRIREFNAAEAILEHIVAGGAQRFSPRIVELDDGRCSVYAEDVAYESLDLTEPGPRHRLRMVKSGWQYIDHF